jgi:segregation and condensation protein A
LPDTTSADGPSAEDMALALAHRLRRLEAFRNVATQLMERPQFNRDIFGRGAPEPIAEVKQSQYTATLYDLLTAYAAQRQRTVLTNVHLKKRNVWSLAEARSALERLIGETTDWTPLDKYLISYVVEPSMAATVFASSFATTLELVREGVAEIHQKQAFAPLYMRKRVGAAPVTGDSVQDA